MSTFEKNAITIANYLEDKMSAAEEEAFIKEMEINEKLRQQYEDELLVSALLQNEKGEESVTSNDLLFQSADEHINMLEAGLEKKVHYKRSPVIQMFRGYRKIAVAVFVIILGAMVFIIQNKKSNQLVINPKTFTPKDSVIKNDSVIKPGHLPAEEITKAPLLKDSIAKINSTAEIQPKKPAQTEDKYPPKDSTKNELAGEEQLSHFTNNAVAENLFKNFYTIYAKSEKDPVEISDYYKSYKERNYTKVLSATDADYRLMGSGQRSDLLKQYMYLYKGLSYLEVNKPDNAIQQLDFILQSAAKASPQYYDAQWYSMLVLLKKNEIGNAKEIADLILQSSSPYKNKAAQILEDLKTIK